MIDAIKDYALAAFAAVASAVVAAGVWLVRTILTDSKRLSLLEQRQDLQHQEIVSAVLATQHQVARIEASNDTAILTQSKIVEVLDRMEKKESAE